MKWKMKSYRDLSARTRRVYRGQMEDAGIILASHFMCVNVRRIWVRLEKVISCLETLEPASS